MVYQASVLTHALPGEHGLNIKIKAVLKIRCTSSVDYLSGSSLALSWFILNDLTGFVNMCVARLFIAKKSSGKPAVHYLSTSKH